MLQRANEFNQWALGYARQKEKEKSETSKQRKKEWVSLAVDRMNQTNYSLRIQDRLLALGYSEREVHACAERWSDLYPFMHVPKKLTERCTSMFILCDGGLTTLPCLSVECNVAKT